jgi:hypothetical protein
MLLACENVPWPGPSGHALDMTQTTGTALVTNGESAARRQPDASGSADYALSVDGRFVVAESHGTVGSRAGFRVRRRDHRRGLPG